MTDPIDLNALVHSIMLAPYRAKRGATVSQPVRGVDYGECAWCYHLYSGDSTRCPETGERGHPECHAECPACAEADAENAARAEAEAS